MVRNQVTDPLFPECPVRNVLARVGEKWSLLVLLTLDSPAAPLRYRDLQKAIPDVSQKMLTQTLRNLEADGLVERKAYAEVPPRVEYALTDRSRSLLPTIHSLVGWALDNFNGILKDREAYGLRKPL